MSDAARFAQSLRESEEADRRAKQAAADRQAAAERRALEALEQAGRLERAQAAHQRAIEAVREAKRTGKGAAAADLAWRQAKAELLELETGKRPAWASQPAAPAADGEASEEPEELATEDDDPLPTQ